MLALREKGLSVRKAEKVIETVLDSWRKSLAAGDPVEIPGVGWIVLEHSPPPKVIWRTNPKWTGDKIMTVNQREWVLRLKTKLPKRN